MDLGDTLGITQVDADLGRDETLLRKLTDLVGYLVGRGLQPCGRVSLVGQ